FRRRFELLEKLGKERYVESIDFRHPRNFFRIVAMMRQRMMRIRHTRFRISAVARLARELKGDDPRDIALKSQHLQVEHQSGMVRVRGRRAHRPVEVRQWILGNIRLRLLDAPLYLADTIEIVSD